MFLILDFPQSFRLALIHNRKLVNKDLKTKKNISEMEFNGMCKCEDVC